MKNYDELLKKLNEALDIIYNEDYTKLIFIDTDTYPDEIDRYNALIYKLNMIVDEYKSCAGILSDSITKNKFDTAIILDDNNIGITLNDKILSLYSTLSKEEKDVLLKEITDKLDILLSGKEILY